MAFPKKKVPLDPPEVLRFRERQKPVDRTIVKAPKSFWAEWDTRWIRDVPLRRAEAAGQGWQPLDREVDKKVQCPYAEGNDTDRFLRNVDTILCKRPKSIGDQNQEDKNYFYKHFLKNQKDSMIDTAGRLGVKNPEQNVTMELKEGEDSYTIPGSAG